MSVPEPNTCPSLGAIRALLGRIAPAIIALFFITELHAEPVLDRALSSATLVTRKGCALVQISFNFRVRYASHFPIAHSDELRIIVRALDPAIAALQIQTQRESLRPPQSKLAQIKAIVLEIDPTAGPTLIIQFYQPVYYQVGQGGDFESVIVAISGPRPSAACKAELLATSGGASWTAKVVPEKGRAKPVPVSRAIPPRSKERQTGTLTDKERREAAAAMDEARAALKKGKLEDAIRLLMKVLKLPENEHSAEAQELIGLARQRNNETGEALAEYNDYLSRYPSGEGADRVRQRVAALETADGRGPAKLRTVEAPEGNSAKLKSGAPNSSTWNMSGSLSQFYIRDDSFRTLRDPSLPPDFNFDEDSHRVHQNELLSSLDLIGVWSNDSAKWKFRFSGSEEHDVSGEDDEITSVAALFIETTIRDWDALARVGRQTRNTGGVLGRFDGALVSWQAGPWLGVNVVGGSPVARRDDEPFRDDKYFYGISVDFGPFWNGLDVSLFAIEQRDRSWIDRQAVGLEARYVNEAFAAFATVDYDIYYGELNAAIFSGTWTLIDKSIVHAGLDYRRSPYLSTWTALQGQPFVTLYDLLKAHLLDEVEQFAIDRTVTYQSATIGYARPAHRASPSQRRRDSRRYVGNSRLRRCSGHALDGNRALLLGPAYCQRHVRPGGPVYSRSPFRRPRGLRPLCNRFRFTLSPDRGVADRSAREVRLSPRR